MRLDVGWLDRSSSRRRVYEGCRRGIATARGQDLSTTRDDKSSGRPPRGPKSGRDVGSALKKAYEGALREEIPADLLDLLRKLD